MIIPYNFFTWLSYWKYLLKILVLAPQNFWISEWDSWLWTFSLMAGAFSTATWPLIWSWFSSTSIAYLLTQPWVCVQLAKIFPLFLSSSDGVISMLKSVRLNSWDKIGSVVAKSDQSVLEVPFGWTTLMYKEFCLTSFQHKWAYCS